MTTNEITEHTTKVGEHTVFYLAAGPEDGPLMIFVHGWPELSLSWRHQLPHFAALGYRAIAPDMRGYGRSSIYKDHAAYGQRQVVGDMIGLLDNLGGKDAIWVGHDWGSPTVWAVASNHPDRCRAVASLCVPYASLGSDRMEQGINRETYPKDEYPYGQWDYQVFYVEHFDKATAPMDANPYTMLKAAFRKGDPAGAGKPANTALISKHGGWFGGLPQAPDFPIDEDVITEDELQVYTKYLKQNGFFGPNSYYMNHPQNAEFAAERKNDGILEMPVLFLGARYDYVCDTMTTGLAEPMREMSKNLTEHVVDSGHWMAQERPDDVNRHIEAWLAEI
jgi:pimeloyl-ACP methyl ester carboxylesterase